MRFWSHVLFSDETQVRLNPVDRRERVRRPKHQRFDAKYIQQSQSIVADLLCFGAALTGRELEN